MVGSQVFINSQILEHEDNPITESIGGVSRELIIHTITEEAWREWKLKLRTSEKPHINYPGLGRFSIMYGKAKTLLRKDLERIKRVKRNYTTFNDPGTKGYGLYHYYLNRFKIGWKQLNYLKIEVNNRINRWKKINQLRNEQV